MSFHLECVPLFSHFAQLPIFYLCMSQRLVIFADLEKWPPAWLTRGICSRYASYVGCMVLLLWKFEGLLWMVC